MKNLMINKEIYSYEAIKITQKIKNLPIKIKKFKEEIEISWDENKINELEINEFLNELINQQCRLDILKENAEINKLIVTKILHSAIKS